jgi:hypothetical protein
VRRKFISVNLRSSAVQKLNIKLEQQHVAVLHDVFLAFHPIQTFFARGGIFRERALATKNG